MFPVGSGSQSGGGSNVARPNKIGLKLGSNSMIKKHKSKLILKINISSLLYLVQALNSKVIKTKVLIQNSLGSRCKKYVYNRVAILPGIRENLIKT